MLRHHEAPVWIGQGAILRRGQNPCPARYGSHRTKPPESRQQNLPNPPNPRNRITQINTKPAPQIWSAGQKTRLSFGTAAKLGTHAEVFPKEPLRFRKIMDEGTPLVINLSKGKLGTDASNLAGGLILAMMTQAAYSRLDIPERERRPYILYADEFHNFSTEALAPMLSELRKTKLGLVLAHQTTSQLRPSVLDAIVGNVGTQIAFRVGAKDAPTLGKILDGPGEYDLINQPNYRFYIRLMVEGVRTRVFSAACFQPD